MIYVISDPHGEYDLFRELLVRIKFTSSDKMYILGDIVDRGNKGIEMLQYVIKQSNIVCLLGNHEEMMLDFFNSEYRDNMWTYNGGGITYEQIVALGEYEARKLLSVVRKFPVSEKLELNGQIFRLAHAGLSYDENGIVHELQSKDFMLWSRNEFIIDTYINNGDIVIFGHTPTSYMGTEDIWHSDDGTKIGIDCGATFKKRMGCLRLDDMQEFYISSN